jgi:tRNA nucleotidyltransferase (CCA-adding enzyme)
MDHVIDELKSLFPEPLHKRLFLVGGMVRDVLLGVECQDVDLVAVTPPADLTSLGFRLVESKSTPNIYFLFHKKLGKVEITRLSTIEQLAEDLERRDFTVNAMAMPLVGGEILDPLGGRGDLEKRSLRTCTPSSLIDDPIRIFRALRFECEGWRMDGHAEQTIASRNWSAELTPIPVERFSQEMLKALAKVDPGRFFRRMLELQVGQEFLPEIFGMASVPAGPLQYHPEGDLFTHSMQALERMSARDPDLKARFCALFHDLGKLSTPEEEYPRHHGHELAGSLAAQNFCKRLRLPVNLQRALQATCRLHGNANRWEELRESTRIKLALGAMKGGIEAILPLVVASDCGGAMPGWEETLKVASLNAAQLGIPKEMFADPLFPPEKCQQLIMQRRVEELRKVLLRGGPEQS